VSGGILRKLSVERICELQAGDRGLSDLLSMTLSADEQVEQLRRTANDQRRPRGRQYAASG